MLLYLHVPFCRAKCAYCAFFSVPFDAEAAEAYAAAVATEAAHFGAALGRPEVETVYFGGGTPSLLPLWALERIVKALRTQFRFARGLEFTLEANPDSVDSAALRDYLRFGVNRLSLGVQSFDDDELKALGRPHTAGQALAAFEAARMAGFRNLSLDLIWGLPGSRLATWKKTLGKAVKDLKPEHISAYSLTLEPGTPLAARHDDGALALPPDAEAARMFMRGSDYLAEHGYLHYEISNYARMGFMSRHNTGYWEGKDYLGLGPSAVSTLKGRRWANPSDVAAYVAAARAGRFAVDPELLSDDDRVRELVMLSLRTARGLPLKEYKTRTGVSFVERHRPLLTLLRNHGLIRLTRDYLRLTENGMLVSNSILERLVFPDDEPDDELDDGPDQRALPFGSGPVPSGPGC